MIQTLSNDAAVSEQGWWTLMADCGGGGKASSRSFDASKYDTPAFNSPILGTIWFGLCFLVGLTMLVLACTGRLEFDVAIGIGFIGLLACLLSAFMYSLLNSLWKEIARRSSGEERRKTLSRPVLVLCIAWIIAIAFAIAGTIARTHGLQIAAVLICVPTAMISLIRWVERKRFGSEP